jgi:hypothetical protein
MLVLAVDDALGADAPFPARVEEELVRPSPVEGDMRLKCSYDIGEGTEGMGRLCLRLSPGDGRRRL